MRSENSGPEPDADPTTVHVQRARAGDATSLAWVVERFSPLLLAQARHRLGRQLARETQPEEVVQDVWARALPALPALRPRSGRATPVLLRFLATTVLYRINELARARARAGGEEAPDALELDDATRGVVTRAAGREAARAVRAAIDELGERDREVVILRGIEQHDTRKVAELCGLTPNAVSLRYRRALEKLRTRLPRSVFDHLGPDVDPDDDPGGGNPRNP